MKKQLLLFAALAVMAGCTAEMDQAGNAAPETAKSGKLTARIGDVETRVAFDEFTGEFSWTAGDQIDVHTTAGYQTAALDANGCFNLTSGSVRDGYAVYPTGIVTSDSDLTLELPDSYDIEAGGMADFYPSPMVALNDPSADDIWFYHAGAVARMVFTELPAETRSILVTLDKRVTGTFAVADPGTDHPVIETDGAASGNTVRFNLDGAPAVSEDGFALNVPIPTGTFNSITASIQDASNAELLSYASTKVRTFPRARGRKIDFSIVIGPWDYHLGNLSAVSVPFTGGSSSLSTGFTSYRSRGEESEPVPFVLEFSSSGAEGTWTTTPPDWVSLAAGNDYGGSLTGTPLGVEIDMRENSLDDAHHNRLVAAGVADNVDLSTINAATGQTIARSTANCYVVKKPGTYRFPLVYGNGLKENRVNESGFHAKNGPNATEYDDAGGRNLCYGRFKDHLDQHIYSPYIATQQAGKSLSPEIVWMDHRGLVRNVAISGTGESAYITFEVPSKYITQGNALIAVLADGEIAWSWHIWVTDENLTATVTAGSHEFAPLNIGWTDAREEDFPARSWYVRARQSYSDETTSPVLIQSTAGEYRTEPVNNLFYQWGRKDPLYTPKNSYKRFYTASGSIFEFTAIIGNSTDLPDPRKYVGEVIRHPYWFIANNVKTPYDWCHSTYLNAWNSVASSQGTSNSLINVAVTKTIYDPSPVGYKVPEKGAFTSTMSSSNLTLTNQNGVDGFLHTSGLFFPSTGHIEHSDAKLDYDAKNTLIWSANSQNNNDALHIGLYSYSISVSGSGIRRSYGMAVRPVKE